MSRPAAQPRGGPRTQHAAEWRTPDRRPHRTGRAGRSRAPRPFWRSASARSWPSTRPRPQSTCLDRATGVRRPSRRTAAVRPAVPRLHDPSQSLPRCGWNPRRWSILLPPLSGRLDERRMLCVRAVSPRAAGPRSARRHSPDGRRPTRRRPAADGGGTATPGGKGRRLTDPRPALAHSRPVFTRHRHPRPGAPNVVTIVLDDLGSRSWAATARSSRPRASTPWRGTAFAPPTCTSPRSARRRGRVSSRAPPPRAVHGRALAAGRPGHRPRDGVSARLRLEPHAAL